MATLQGKAVKNTYRQVLQIGANNIGVSASLQPVQDGAGVNTALSLSTLAATVNGDLTVTGDLIITGGGLQIKELIDDTVAALIKNGTGITWTYNDAANTLTGNFTGTTSVVPEGTNLYYTQGRFDSAFAAKSTTNLAEGTNLYFTEARGNANFATNLAASDTNDLAEGSTNLYYTNARARTALSVTAGTGLSYDNTTGVFNLAAIPNASLTNSSITINGQAVSLGGTVTLTTTNIAEGTNLYWTTARGNANFATNLAASSTTNLAEGTNLYYTQARFDTAFSNKSTTNLAEGTNLYYTQTRFNNALAAKTTTDLAEGTNLYYTDARARLALSSSATGLSYANNSGVFSLTAGYAIPTTVKLGQYDIAYNRSIVSAAVTGTSTKTLSLTQQDANVITATWTDQGITTINGTANQIAATTVGNTTTLAFTNDVTMPNNLVVSGNLTINGTATYVNTESISSKDPLFEVANTNNTTDAVDIGYYGRYYDAVQERVEFTGLFRDASDAGKFKIFTGLVDEPTNVVNTTGTGYTVATLVANVDGNLNGTANAANILSTARTIAASGDATWSVSFNGSANVSSALTLANTGVTATTYGTSTAVPTIAVDSKGRITSASNTNITFPVTTVNGFAGTVVLTTSDVAEGTNQYFTTARAQAAISGTAPISVASGVVSITQSSAINNGFLSSTDWNTFNDKLSTATAATIYVPYTGATGNVNIGTYTLSAAQVRATSSAGLSINANGGTQIANLGAGGGANMTLYGGLTGTTGSFESSGSGGTFAINHTSGSGVALNITKGGNGEGLYINKASGSGNAATIIGTLNATTLVKSGGTASQFLMADGSVNTSVLPSGAYLPLTGGTLTGALSGTSATFSGNVTLTSGYLETPWTNDTKTVWERYNSATYFQRISSNAPARQLRLESNGAYGNASIVLDGQSNDTVTATITADKVVSTGSLVVQNGNVLSVFRSDNARAIQLYTTNDACVIDSWAASSEPLRIRSNGSGGRIEFHTNGTDRLRITNSGELQLKNPGFTSYANTIKLGTYVDYTGGSYISSGSNPSLTNRTSLDLGTADGSGILIVNDASRTIRMASLAGSGSRTVTADASGNLSASSDSSLKQEDKEYKIQGLAEILQLQPRAYKWLSDIEIRGEEAATELGFFADEVNPIIPSAAPKGNDDLYGFYDRAVIAAMVKAIQELSKKVDALEAK
jgi:hypothetical protein